MQLVQTGGPNVNWQRVNAIAAMQGKALITMVRDAKEKYCYTRGRDDSTSPDAAREVELVLEGSLNLEMLPANTLIAYSPKYH